MVTKTIEKSFESPPNIKKKRKNRYIPGLAALRFEPDDDWSKKDAKKCYDTQTNSIGLYEIDKVYYQDSIVGMKNIPPESVDLIIADPPFGLDFSGKESIYNRDSEYVIEGYTEVQNEYSQFTRQWISELPRIMKETASAYIFSGWTNLEDVLKSIRESGLIVQNHIIWQYQFGVFTRKKFVSSHYHLLFIVKNPKKYYFNRIEHYTLDIWDIKRDYDQKKKKNGTKLPIELIRRCIDFSSKPGDIILDPFMGNGTTAEAAKATYRHFLGFEINIYMKEAIEKNISAIELGDRYSKYSSRLPSPEELKEKYPLAYRIYKQENERVKRKQE